MAFFLSFLSGVILFYLSQYFPFSAILISVISLLFPILKKKYLLIPVIAFGIFYAFLRYEPDHDLSFVRGKELLVSGAFVSEADRTAYKNFVQGFHIDSAMDADTEESLAELEDADIKIISDTKFDIGSKYELIIEAGKNKAGFNPGGISNNDFYAYLRGVGDLKEDKKSIWVIFQKARVELNRHITDSFSPDSAALISSITTGQRSEMSEYLRDAFNSTGLAHILSISGTHFGLFSVFLFGVFRFLIKNLPYRILHRLTIYITPSQGAAILCLPFMIAYLGLSGASIPAVRSFIMIGLFLIGLLIGRKGFWLNSLLFAAFVIVLWNPAALLSLSFQLSFLAVLFIGFSIGYMKDKEDAGDVKSGSTEDKNFLPRSITSVLHVFRSSLLITLAASLGTAPLVAYHFYYFSVISPISNLFITPLIGFVLLPFALLSALIFLLTGHYVFAPVVKAISNLTVYLVTNISHLPFVDIKIPAFPVFIVVCFYLGAVFYFFKKNKNSSKTVIARSPESFRDDEATSRRMGLPRFARNDKIVYSIVITIIAASLAIYFAFTVISKEHNISITHLDVGQGDSALVEFPDNKVLLIDTGKSGKEAAAFLRYRGRKTIDAIVLSHGHPDHIGGLEYLTKHFRVKEVWDNGRLIYPPEAEDILNGINYRTLERGDVIEGTGYKIYVLHPYKEFYTMDGDEYNEGNNSSLVLKIVSKGKSFLFSGDIEEEAEEDIAHLNGWLKSNVIKVPHHGGKTSASQIFVDEVSPEIAVISAGRDNPFGHPHNEILELFDNTKVYRTDRDGAIKITEKDGNLEVKTYKDFQFSKAKNFKDEMRNLKRLFEVW